MAQMVTNENADEVDVHRFASEASDLRLKPGEWPAQLQTNLGNGLPFIQVGQIISPAGEFGGCRYRQANGCISLSVFND